ncbi:MAG: LysM peptidoglycan-binding domain-containing protein, partial [Chloroflexota bacterium]|nr:LysM peptidoglycan-binding domain-containing protein [Chloroflexota bacterium]
MKRLLLISLALLLLSLTPLQMAAAQENAPKGPIYVIQPGDSLWGIARRMHVDYLALLEINNLTEESQVLPGDQLVMPGLEGVQGFLATQIIPYGESLESLSHRYQIPENALLKMNRITSPIELYAGVSLVLVGDEEGIIGEPEGGRVTPAEGQPLLEVAAKEGLNPWTLVLANSLSGTWDAIPGRVLHIPNGGDTGPGGLPHEIRSVSYIPEQLVQGQTTAIQVSAPNGTQIEGELGGHPLHFFSISDGLYIALQGIHAMEKPGLISLSIQGVLPGGKPFAHRQMIPILSGDYPYRAINGVPTETVDPEVSASDTEQLASYAAVVTPDKRWDGSFQVPMPSQFSNPGPLFGERRSFNGSGYYYYHSGLDFSTWGQEGIDILAPASGEVVFIGELVIFGNVTMLNHGWGV